MKLDYKESCCTFPILFSFIFFCCLNLDILWSQSLSDLKDRGYSRYCYIIVEISSSFWVNFFYVKQFHFVCVNHFNMAYCSWKCHHFLKSVSCYGNYSFLFKYFSIYHGRLQGKNLRCWCPLAFCPLSV